MKKSFKVILSALVVLVMMSALTLVSFGAEYLEYVDSDGNVYTYTQTENDLTIHKIALKNSGTNLVIPNTINGRAVTRIGNNIFSDTNSQRKLEGITIPDTVNYIYSFAFSGCVTLKNVIYGNVTNLEIWSNSFSSCSALESVTFGKTKNVIIYGNAFMDRENLKSVDFGNPTNMQIKNMCFKNTGLTEITVPKGVLLGQYVFSECPKLVKAEVHASPLTQVEKRIDTQTGKVVSQKDVFSEYLFYKCPVLREVTISDYEIIYENMFGECPALEKVNVGNATKIGYSAFSNCTSLKHFDCNGKVDIGYMSFAGCTGLEYFDFTKVSKLGDFSFKRCTSLKSADLSNQKVIGDSCFNGCTSLTELNLSGGTKIEDHAFSGCTGLRELHIYSNINICNSAFENCTGLEKIFIEDNVEYIDLLERTNAGTYFSYDIFEGCTNVKYIYIGASFLPKVQEKDIVYLAAEFFGFHNLTGLETIEVSPNNPYYRSVDDVLYVDEGDVYILLCYPQAKKGTYYSTEKALSGVSKDFSLGEDAFYLNQNLKEVHFTKSVVYPDFMNNRKDLRSQSYELLWGSFAESTVEKVTFPKGGLKTVGDSMFSGSAIRDIDLSETETIKRYAFEDCPNITELNLPFCTELKEGAFKGCKSLKSVNLPLWSGTSDNNSYDIFYNCTALESVNMPLVARIPGSCFYGCTSLVNVNAPDCERLDNYCFYGCTSLESLDMTVTYVGKNAFTNCTRLKSIRFYKAYIYEEAFLNCTSLESADGVRSAGKNAFKGCTSIESLSGISSVGESAFEGCVSLKNIKFSGVKGIGDRAFKDCTSLYLAQFDSSKCTFGKNAFEGCEKLSFYCDENSSAYEYAVANNIPLIAVSISFLSSQYAYTGSEIQPGVIVSIGDMALVQNRDYTLSFNNNVRVGGAEVIVHFIGDFDGLPDAYRTFSIVRRDISDADIEYVKDNIYEGEDIRPAVVIKLDGKTLIEDIDYKIIYQSGADTGTMLFTVQGLGNYKGSVDCYYNIVRRDIAEATVEKLPDCIYTGNEICPIPVIQWNGFTLVNGEDFEVRYFENVNAGFGIAVIYGKGNFCGTQRVNFRIFGKGVENAAVSDIPDMAYNGAEQKPAITVTVDGAALKEGTDYTVEYINNTEQGTAEVIISGIGNYSGVIRKTFNIYKNSVNSFTVFSDKTDSVYSGEEQKPEIEVYFDGELLLEGVDYEISITDNISAGTATVTIIGIGRFEGERIYNFTIQPCEISEKDISVSGRLEFTGIPVEPEITVTKDGKTLENGKDYSVTYYDNDRVGKAFATVEGIGNYCGIVNLEYEIYNNEDKNPEPQKPESQKPDAPEQNEPSKDNTDSETGNNNGNVNNGTQNGENKPQTPPTEANKPSEVNNGSAVQIPNTDAETNGTAVQFAVIIAMLMCLAVCDKTFRRKTEE